MGGRADEERRCVYTQAYGIKKGFLFNTAGGGNQKGGGGQVSSFSPSYEH